LKPRGFQGQECDRSPGNSGQRARELHYPSVGGESMKAKPEILVTLSDELFDRLRAQSRELHVSMKYLVASLVCDTMEPVEKPLENLTPRPARQVA
jgi:hypothetical protein